MFKTRLNDLSDYESKFVPKKKYWMIYRLPPKNIAINDIVDLTVWVFT